MSQRGAAEGGRHGKRRIPPNWTTKLLLLIQRQFLLFH